MSGRREAFTESGRRILRRHHRTPGEQLATWSRNGSPHAAELYSDGGNGRNELARASRLVIPWFSHSKLMWTPTGWFVKKENGEMHRIGR